VKALVPTADYYPHEFRNWIVGDGILRLKHDRHFLLGLSWDALQCFEPDCGCRFFEVTLCLVPTIVLTFQWFWDNPRCPEVIANRAGAEREM
jgi:hypothetical protein